MDSSRPDLHISSPVTQRDIESAKKTIEPIVSEVYSALNKELDVLERELVKASLLSSSDA